MPITGLEHTNSKYASPAYNNFDGHSYYKDFTYIQIKNITLGYNFEKNFVKKLGLSGLESISVWRILIHSVTYAAY